MDEATLIHTLDTEAYAAAKNAAKASLLASDMRTLVRLEELGQEEGVVGDAAREILDEQ